MKQRTLLVSLVILVLVAGLLLLLWRQPRSEPVRAAETQETAKLPPEPPRPPAVGREKRPKATADDPRIKRFLAAFSAPIAFFGKVVDEAGSPVPQAQIRLGAADNPTGEDGTDYNLISDAQGRFELRDAKGESIVIWAAKQGYYSTEASKGRFVYGGVRGGGEPPNPTPDNPAIFMLKKMGETVPLVRIPLKSIRVPKDGAPVEIDLSTGRPTTAGSGHLRFEVWTANEGLDPNLSQPYDWKARVTVPGGGLVERIGEYDFLAPEDGYSPVLEMEMSKTALKWRKGFQKQFFARLQGGQFARFDLELTTAGDHFVTVESFLNPESGNRNLEFDPAKAIKPQ